MNKAVKRYKDREDAKALPIDDRPELGYDAWLAAEIKAGCAELVAGKGIPAAQVWKELGLE